MKILRSLLLIKLPIVIFTIIINNILSPRVYEEMKKKFVYNNFNYEVTAAAKGKIRLPTN